VVAADLFADADLARACPVTRIENYPEGLADWLADTPCDGWLYTGALENHPALVDRMAKLRPLLGNRGDVLRQVRDPLLLQKVLGAMRVNFPETKPCDGTHPDAGEWLHKTGQGGNGSGVGRAGPQGQAPRLATGYWQREIKGMPGSAQYVAGFGSCSLVGVTRQLVGEAWTGAGEFQYCGTLASGNPSPTFGAYPRTPPQSIGEGDCGWALTETLTAIGLLLAIPFGMSGLFGVDFIFDGEQVWIIEVNPRITAAVEVVERVMGHNLLAKHLNAFYIPVEQREAPEFPAAGKVVLYAKQPVVVSQRMSEQLLAAADNLERPRLSDIPTPGTRIACGEPILTVLAEGHDLTTVEANLRQRAADLEIQLYRNSGGS
jgi:predicted ATP-grasp superfamily ATP-dependent carboligase